MVDKSYWSRNMHRLTLLFFFFFKFVGLATFSLNNQANLNKKNSENTMFFISSKLGILYNLFGSCLIIALSFYSIPITLYSDYIHKTIITNIIEIFLIILGCFVMISTLLFYCIFESVIIKIGNYLINTENLLRHLQQPLNRKHIFNVLFLICLFMLILFIILLITEIKNFNPGPIVLMANIVPLIFVSLLFIQYFFVLNLIYAIFVKLNCIIQNFCRSRYDDINLKVVNQTRCVFMSYSRIHLFIQIRDIYNHLCDISREVSHFYSFSILTALSFIFLVILYNSYYLFLLFVNELNFLLITNTIIWIMLPLSLLALLTSKVTKVINEVGRFKFFFFFFENNYSRNLTCIFLQIEKTGYIIHILLNCTIDRETKIEVK